MESDHYGTARRHATGCSSCGKAMAQARKPCAVCAAPGTKLIQLDSRFLIPCLEELLITLTSPLKAEHKLNTLESLVKYSVNLQSMVIRIYTESTSARCRCLALAGSLMPGSRRGGPASSAPGEAADGQRGCGLTVDVERASLASARDGDRAPAWEGNVGLLCSWRPHLLCSWSGRGRPARCGLTVSVDRASPAPARRRTGTELRCGTTTTGSD
ncbi:hypothetical protein QYE76_066585 [Lolium multiflorum]|uniref:Uncharacterized protein n=1 Tax=Lolium multiflorum TaxID=4521 RepID=A0AAD8SD94_LOLMU|nr:hypothetical protein QYE76_066585 [Lolium multiflorum]